MMGDQQELSLERRLLYDLEQAVGRISIHLLRKIDQHRAVAALKSAERQGLKQMLGLTDGYKGIFTLDSES